MRVCVLCTPVFTSHVLYLYLITLVLVICIYVCELIPYLP